MMKPRRLRPRDICLVRYPRAMAGRIPWDREIVQVDAVDYSSAPHEMLVHGLSFKGWAVIPRRFLRRFPTTADLPAGPWEDID